jgi:hypothetical protein
MANQLERRPSIIRIAFALALGAASMLDKCLPVREQVMERRTRQWRMAERAFAIF